jgi:hypothetical protein
MPERKDSLSGKRNLQPVILVDPGPSIAEPDEASIQKPAIIVDAIVGLSEHFIEGSSSGLRAEL